MKDELPTPVYYITCLAVFIGALLLVVPFTPPQAAIAGFIAVFAIGVSAYIAFTITAQMLVSAADDVLPEVPVEEELISEELKQAYFDGELTDKEFEAAIEKELAKEEGDETSEYDTSLETN